MDKKTTAVLLVIVAVIVVGGVIWLITVNKNYVGNTSNNAQNNIAQQPTNNEPAVKEFSMTSFVEMVNGTPKPQFSLKEMTVNKGDKVRIKITVTSGAHDFKIDEFNIYADTQLNKEYVVEFTADKTGEFIYYCAKPGHRQNGQWGTLKVI